VTISAPGRKHLLAAALLVLASCAVFANSFGNSFIWDDQEVIIDDPFIRNADKMHLLFSRDYWQGAHGGSYAAGQYRPLSAVSFSLDYALWKDDTFGYHLTNLGLHIANVILVYFLVIMLAGGREGRPPFIPAFLAALFFAVYPVHVESVTWIKNRSDLLSSLFFLSSFLLFAEYIRREDLNSRLWCLTASFALFSAALLSKEMALTLPFFLFFYAAYFVPRGKLQRPLLGMLPFFALMGVFTAFKLTIPRAASSVLGGLEFTGHFQRLLAVIKTYGYYIRLLVWPFDLNAERVFKLPGSPLEPAVLLPAAALLALLAFILKTFRREKLAGFFVLWVIVSLAPVSNIVLLAGRPIAEQRLYLPSAGFCMLVSLVLCRLGDISYGRLPAKASKITAAALAGFLVLAYSAVTIDRNKDWKDPLTFWSMTLEQSPGSGRAHNNLAYAYSSIGENEKAVPLYNRSIELMPDYARAYNNLGAAYGSMGRYEEALGLIKAAIRMDPVNSVDYYNNLANVYLSLGQKEKAVQLYKKTLEMNPYRRDASSNLSSVYLRQGRYEDVIRLNEELIKRDPGNAGAYHDLALAYSFTGKVPRAVQLYKKAASLAPGRAATYRNLGVIFGASGRTEKSMDMLQKALELNPSSAETLNYIGVAHFSAGDRKEAVSYFKKALENRPGHLGAYRNLTSVYDLENMHDEAISLHNSMLGAAGIDRSEVYYNLALAHFGKGDVVEAENYFKKTLDTDPGHIGAYNNLGVILGGRGRMDEAERMFKKSIQVTPENPNAYYNMALLCFRENRHQEALEYYQKAEALGIEEPGFKGAVKKALERQVEE